MSISPGRLLDISGVGDPVSVVQTNAEITSEELYEFIATYQSGTPTTLIGPPTSGTRIIDERWKDAWLGEWRCTVAGTPGTWRQEKAAVRAGEPSSGTIPTGYLIQDSSDDYRLKIHMGSYVWRLVHAGANYGELTGLTGGGSSNLDGVVTAGLDTGTVAQFLVSGALETYRLKAGTNAEVSPWIVRPDDYNGSSNAKVWERVTRADYPGNVARELTGLTGSTVADLNYIPTVDMTVGTLVKFLLSSSIVEYRLRSGTDATNSPTIIRPIDFQSVTNPKVWERMSIVATPGDIMIGNNNLSEVASTANKRASARSNIDVLWRDDVMAFLSSRQPLGGIFGKATSGWQITGTTGLVIGTTDFSVQFTFRTLASQLSSSSSMLATHSTGNSRFDVLITGSGTTITLRFTDSGGSATDYLLTPDVLMTPGQVYNAVVTVDRDGLATLYLNAVSDRDMSGSAVAVSVSASSAVDIGSGNANTWAAIGAYGGTLFAFNWFNYILTTAEVLLMAGLGRVRTENQWGSLSNNYASDFSAGTDSWTAGAGTLTGNIDGIGGVDDTLRYYADNTSSQHRFFRTTANANHSARVSFSYYIPSANTNLDKFSVRFTDGTESGTVTPTYDAWTTYTFDATNTGSGVLQIITLNSAGVSTYTGAGVSTDDLMYVKSATVKHLGSILCPDLENADPEMSTAVKDRSSNANHGTTAASNIVQVVRKRQGNFASGLAVGASTVLTKLLSATATLDFGSIAAAASADLTITVTGAAVGDAVAIGLPAAPAAGIVFFGFVSATNTVTVRAMNITGAPVDPGSATYRATVMQF